MQYYPWIENNT